MATKRGYETPKLTSAKVFLTALSGRYGPPIPHPPPPGK
jgi:hypothetical protein